MQQQQREQRARLGAAERDGAVRVARLDRPEQPEVDRRRRRIEGAEAAGEVDERFGIGGHVAAADAADDDPVVAGRVLGLEVAVDDRQRVAQDLRVGEAVGARRGGVAREVAVSRREHVDREAPGVPHPPPRE